MLELASVAFQLSFDALMFELALLKHLSEIIYSEFSRTLGNLNGNVKSTIHIMMKCATCVHEIRKYYSLCYFNNGEPKSKICNFLL